jgi:hypothetical protein
MTTNLLGTIPLVHKLGGGSIHETGAYIGLPILLVVASFARSRRQDRGARLLVTLLAIVCIASLGSTLRVRDNLTIPMP